MTREEAVRRIDDHMYVHRLNEPSAIYITEALKMALDALRGPQPDPITGLMPCGGRKAVMWCTPGEGYWVASGKIGQINGFDTKMAAKEAWNTDMGYTAPNGDEGVT